MKSALGLLPNTRKALPNARITGVLQRAVTGPVDPFVRLEFSEHRLR